MGINLRTERRSEIQNLIEHFQQREKKVTERKNLEGKIANDNLEILKRISSLLTPICKKVGYSIYVSIEDNKTVISALLHKQEIGCRISFESPPIREWLNSYQNTFKIIKDLELKMRYAKQIFGKNILRRELASRVAVVAINTRTKYF